MQNAQKIISKVLKAITVVHKKHRKFNGTFPAANRQRESTSINNEL